MTSSSKRGALLVACAVLLVCRAVGGQTLEQVWTHNFPKPLSWYVRTSAGILIVRSGKELAAIDGATGSLLWSLPTVDISTFLSGPEEYERAFNVLEVPLTGVLLLNRAVLPGESKGRLIALNLLTGEKLWDQPQVDVLMTAVPLYGSRDVVVVSTRLQKKVMAAEIAASAASRIPITIPPFRYEFERLDLATGKVEWTYEYPHIFIPGSVAVQAVGNHLFLYYNNRLLGCIDLETGKQLWEDSSKLISGQALPLPLSIADGKLIYSSSDVKDVDPSNGKPAWTIAKLGKATGLSLEQNLFVALGGHNIVAVDAATGAERWRRRTYGHTTNLLWNQASDSLVFVDGKGLHSVDRTTGKPRLDARLIGLKHEGIEYPNFISLASPDVVVMIATDRLSAYSLKTGAKLFAEGKLVGFYPSVAYLDHWPIPIDGEDLVHTVPAPSSEAQWDIVRKSSLLPASILHRVEANLSDSQGFGDAYETELETGERRVWWIDPQTGSRQAIGVADEHHDVSTPLGMIFAVDGSRIWGAKIVPTGSSASQ
ncbi:MAG TPA: PQQ-binding-like beta-propeller repeat protein [Candidatus Limnocylindrales bacterium]|nr:PQQ-binding-like beta-propeller repeat protein [Candidatus Limnocylindrales bacterium]